MPTDRSEDPLAKCVTQTLHRFYATRPEPFSVYERVLLEDAVQYVLDDKQIIDLIALKHRSKGQDMSNIALPVLPDAPEIKSEQPRESAFQKELENLINRYSQENGSDTPDFILAEYLTGCLATFNRTVIRREEWYGRKKEFPPSTKPISD